MLLRLNNPSIIPAATKFAPLAKLRFIVAVRAIAKAWMATVTASRVSLTTGTNAPSLLQGRGARLGGLPPSRSGEGSDS